MEFPTHRRERTVFVNNLTPTTTEDDLFTLFQRAGPIEKVIFKNVDGTPQHALIVFRRVDSVVFCLENTDYFVLKGQALGIRPLRESKLTGKPPLQMPHSAGYNSQQHFNFDSECIKMHNNTIEDVWPPVSPSWHRRDFAPAMAPPTCTKRFAKPANLHLPKPIPSISRQIWVPADQRDAFSEPFTAPPFSTANRFVFPGQTRTLDQFHGMFDNNENLGVWPNVSSMAEHFGNK